MIKFLDLSSEIKDIRKEVDYAINNVINKANFIMGDEVIEFENNFAEYITTKHCIGVANGTDALEIAVKSLYLQPNDEIITQANTFISTCLGASNNNLNIKLVDVDPNTYQMDLDLLEQNISLQTKVVIIVHLTGSCCNMERLMDIVERNNLILIEDCAQSHGAFYNNKRLGSFGTLSTFSFYPGKNLGAFGDGGAICTNNANLAEKIRKLRNLGSIEKYKHEIIGRNSRLDTLQAAILNVKLSHLDQNNQKRRDNANLYNELLKDLPGIEIPQIEDLCIPVYHLYIVRSNKRDQLQKFLLEKGGVQTGVHYPISISDLKCYEGEFIKEHYKNSIENSKKILSLPMYPNLPHTDILKICELIKSFTNENL